MAKLNEMKVMVRLLVGCLAHSRHLVSDGLFLLLDQLYQIVHCLSAGETLPMAHSLLSVSWINTAAEITALEALRGHGILSIPHC